MDIKSELWNARWLIASFITAIITFSISYEEFAYTFRGIETNADVENIFVVKLATRLGKPAGSRYFVQYSFSELDGTRQTGFGYKEMDWECSPTVEVEYTPGRISRSRMAGTANRKKIVLFLSSLMVLLVSGYRYWKSETPEERMRKWYT